MMKTLFLSKKTCKLCPKLPKFPPTIRRYWVVWIPAPPVYVCECTICACKLEDHYKRFRFMIKRCINLRNHYFYYNFFLMCLKQRQWHFWLICAGIPELIARGIREALAATPRPVDSPAPQPLAPAPSSQEVSQEAHSSKRKTVCLSVVNLVVLQYSSKNMYKVYVAKITKAAFSLAVSTRGKSTQGEHGVDSPQGSTLRAFSFALGNLTFRMKWVVDSPRDLEWPFLTAHFQLGLDIKTVEFRSFWNC